MSEALVVANGANIASREYLTLARQALAEADTLPDISRMVDRAEVVRQMAKRAELGLQSQNDWAAFKLDAERKAGSMLAEMKANDQRSKGGRPTNSGHDDRSSEGNGTPTLVDLGVAAEPEKAQSRAKRWQALAALPEEDYEAFKAEAQENGAEITEAAALRLAKEKRDAEQRQQQAAQGQDEWPAAEREMRARVEAGETVTAHLKAHGRLIAWAQGAELFVRIDRQNDWGNPFEMPGDGDRETVIRNYEEHYLPFKPSLLRRLDVLKGKVLGCWCAPEPCHGDVLKSWAEGMGK